jgi:beta-N-acetylhexosaminidase
VPALEPRPDTPATLSRAVLTGLLREQLGYQGLILTDALDMGAIKRDRGAAEAAVEAFEAGADLLLIAGITQEDRARLAEGPRALLAAVRSGRVSESRLDASVLRVLVAKARRGLVPVPGAGSLAQSPGPPPGLAAVGSSEHRALALEAARKAIALVRDEPGALPLRPSQRILVISPDHPTRSRVEEDGTAGSLAEAVRRHAPSAEDLRVETAPSAATIARAVEGARAADVVVLATYDLAQQPPQAALAQALQAAGRPIVAVALRGPYDAAALPGIGTFLAAYGDRPVHLRAAAEALFGALTPTGRVP